MSELTATGSGSPITKPLMLMLPWLGSRPQAVDKYCEIYFRTGFDVIVVESEVKTSLKKIIITLFKLHIIKTCNKNHRGQ